jgi:hypothetical protein
MKKNTDEGSELTLEVQHIFLLDEIKVKLYMAEFCRLMPRIYKSNFLCSV